MSALSPKPAGRILLTLFIVSGFAGLIYQSVWSQYLGLTLGHAAYAQTLVLSIFMGGMALGAWFVSRRTTSWRRLIMGYGLVELLIGVVGISFQSIFQAYTQLSQESVLPLLESETIAHGYQWISAAFLILPQSLLLGATFPLLSAGYLRIAPRQDGEVLGGLYFTNSLGAALGALAATFLILPLVGLPGTVMTAGGLNILVGLGAWLVSNRIEECVPAQTPASSTSVSSVQNTENKEVRRLGRIMLIATAISGSTSFVYELGWVRMLNQALGSSLHSFELMLTAFILGLAFGGLWIRHRSSRINDPIRYVGYAQVFMGIAALFSIPAFALSFHWVGWIMEGLARTGNGYTLFELGTAVISLAVMFPAAFFAGMTLPLFTMALLRAGADERAIGRVYAANTLGSILGVLFMVHILIPVMGVKLGLMLAALVDAILGLYLLRMLSPARLTPGLVAATLSLLVATGISASLGKVDPAVQVSGVFRTGNVRSGNDVTVPFLRDGKTATVAVISHENIALSIVTNGKPDAAMAPFDRPPIDDEITMIMLGLMPLVAHPAPKDVALIGWGSGLSTHTILGSPVPQSVETIEIEKTMHDAARVFGTRVARAYTDPRSQLRIDDARTFFSVGNRQYDAIVSEPSNPWVSGVANLFTVEFYRFLKRHLKNDGVLVQWLHTYELSDPLLATMLSALISEFPNAEIYSISGNDLLILAPKEELSRPFQDAPWRETALAAELARVGLGSLDDVVLRRIGGGEVIRQYVRLLGAQPHSDYYPEVSLNAPKARFERQSANFLHDLLSSELPILDILDCRVPLSGTQRQLLPKYHMVNIRQFMALQVADALRSGQLSTEFKRNIPSSETQNISHALFIVRQTSSLDTPEQIREWSFALSTLAEATIGGLPAEDLRGIWKSDPAWLPVKVSRLPLAMALMRTYAATAARDPLAMLQEAEAVLAMPEAASLAPEMREYLLLVANLGALGVGDSPKVADLERLYGKENVSARFLAARSYLLAWADSGVPACVSAARQ